MATLCWNVFDAVSSFRHVFVSVALLVALLGPHLVLAVLFTFLQWHLGLFRIGGFACHFCDGGLCFSLEFYLMYLHGHYCSDCNIFGWCSGYL